MEIITLTISIYTLIGLSVALGGVGFGLYSLGKMLCKQS